MDTKSLVLKTLNESGNPMKSEEIAAKAGIEKAEVDKVIKILKKEDKITSPKNCYYSPK